MRPEQIEAHSLAFSSMRLPKKAMEEHGMRTRAEKCEAHHVASGPSMGKWASQFPSEGRSEERIGLEYPEDGL